MPEQTESTPVEPEATTEAPAPAEPTTDPEGASALGDAGKRALDAMKSERNQARRDLADVQARLAVFEDAQKSAEQKAEEAAKAAERRAHEAVERIAAAEARAALTGIVDDPKDFVSDLNLQRFITPDGDVDSDAIAKLREKYERRGPKTVAPNPAQGANGSKKQAKQLSRDDLKTMTPDQINQAYKDGLLNSAMGITA